MVRKLGWILGPILDRFLVDFWVPKWLPNRQKIDFLTPREGVKFLSFFRGSKKSIKSEMTDIGPEAGREKVGNSPGKLAL